MHSSDRAFVRALFLALLPLVLFPASASGACLELGGREFCGNQRPNTRWTIDACDEASSQTARRAAWCTARGGTWNGSNCLNPAPHTDGNVVQHSILFAKTFWASSSCTLTGDTGYGITIPTSWCFTGGDVYEVGELKTTRRRLTISCVGGGAETISIAKGRSLACPTGYTHSSVSPIGEMCKKPPEDCKGCKVGNPVTPGTGVKVENEVDYRHASGLTLSRHYHSFRFYEPWTNATTSAHTENRFGHVWRSNFDKRVIPLPNICCGWPVRHARTLPTGEVQYFNASGAEVYNYGEASGSLATAPEGFYYKGPDSTEFYGTDGRLRTITQSTGQVLTLTYSDGTTGPNGGFILDAAGNATTWTLPINRLIRVSDAFGNTLLFGYDLNARVVMTTEPGGGVHRYTYDEDSNLTSVTFPDLRTRTYRYNETANMPVGTSIPYVLTSIEDENGTVFANFKYDALSRAVSTERAGGAGRYLLTYNADGTTSLTDPLDTARSFGFVNTDGITRFTGSSLKGGAGYGAGVKQRTYDAAGNIASQTNFKDIKTCYAYLAGRNLETVRVEGVPAATSCTTVLTAGATLPTDSRKVVTEWHARWRKPVRISEPLRRTIQSYNGDPGVSCAPGTAIIEEGATDAPIGVVCSRSVQATSNANGSQGFDATLIGTARVFQYTYNANGSVLTVDGPRTDVADTTTYTYYANDDADQAKRGNVATITNAASHVTSMTSYNVHGQPLTVIDPNGMTTTFTYDDRQRLKTRSAGGELTSYDYDFVGQVTKVTLPDGSFLNYDYDDAHRLTEISDGVNRIAYDPGLDAMGNRTLEQVFAGTQLVQKRSRVYDSLNRLFKELGALNQPTEYAYDDQGNVLTIKDPLNHTTSNQYDVLNRLKEVTDPGLGVTQYAYNGLDALTQVTDPRSLVTGYEVGGLGNLMQQSSPDTGTTINAYDAAGNLITRTDALGQVRTYAYDALNRVTSISYAFTAQGSAYVTETYIYDQGTNGIGRLSGVVESSDASSSWNPMTYAYDLHGRVTEMTSTPRGVQYVTSYAYDSSGRLTGMTYPGGRTVTYGFDALGRINQITTTKDGQSQTVVQNVVYHPFGGVKAYTLGNGRVYSRDVDLDGRIASYTLGGQSFGIGYDNASRIEFISDLGTPANVVTYGYDDVNRLTSAVTPSTPYSYTYDSVGNRTSRTAGSGTDTYTPSTTSNRIAQIATSSGVRTFDYDSIGATIDDGNNWYFYDDPRGRPTKIGNASYNASTPIFNALGQRIEKFVMEEGPFDHDAFHYDINGRLISETTIGGSPKREIIYLGDIPVGVVQ